MLATCIGPTIFTEKESPVKATSPTGGKVGLDYTYIFEKLNNLSSIVLTPDGIDNGIYKGRDFGTDGERYAATKIQEWMKLTSTNLSATTYMEPLSYKKGLLGWNHWEPHKADITGFSLQLKNGTHPAFTISTNESFPVVSFPPFNYKLPYYNYSCSDYYTIEPYDLSKDQTYPLDEYDFHFAFSVH